MTTKVQSFQDAFNAWLNQQIATTRITYDEAIIDGAQRLQVSPVTIQRYLKMRLSIRGDLAMLSDSRELYVKA